MAHERKLVHTQYLHFGHTVCRDLFISLHSIGKDILVNIARHMCKNGRVLREKRSGGRNTKALTFEEVGYILS